MSTFLNFFRDLSTPSGRLNLTIKMKRHFLENPNTSSLFLPGALNSLADDYWDRFKQQDHPEDLDEALRLRTSALELVSDSNPWAHTDAILTGLAICYRYRYQRTGKSEDIDDAIKYADRAVKMISPDNPHMPGCLNNLAICYSTRFKTLGTVEDIDQAIALGDRAVEATSQYSTNQFDQLLNLGYYYRDRFKCVVTPKVDDIDKAVEYCKRAVDLLKITHVEKPVFLTGLANTHVIRFERLGNEADIDVAIRLQEQALTLAEPGKPGWKHRPRCLDDLGKSYLCRFNKTHQMEDVEKAIELQRKSVELSSSTNPLRHYFLNSLAISYMERYNQLGALEDLNQAIVLQFQSIDLTYDVNKQPGLLHDLANNYSYRYERLGDPKDVQKALELGVKALSLCSDGVADKHMYENNIGTTYIARYNRLRKPQDLDEAITHITAALKLIPVNHQGARLYRRSLAACYGTRFDIKRDSKDLDKAIALGSQVSDAYEDGHPDKPACLNNLGMGYLCRALSGLGTSAEEDLDHAIKLVKNSIQLGNDRHPSRLACLLNGGHCYEIRFLTKKHVPDSEEARSLYKQAANLESASPSEALKAARVWASLAQRQGNVTEAISGYQRALELLPRIAWTGLQEHARQGWLQEVKPELLGCEAAACAASGGFYEKAVELLDMSRSVFWEQASVLRSNIDKLKELNQTLGAEFEQVLKELDAGTFTVALDDDNWLSATITAGQDATAFRVALASQYEGLLAQARRIDGLEDFLKPKRFKDLCTNITCGYVVILLVNSDSVQALVIRPGGNIKNVALPGVTPKYLQDHARQMHTPPREDNHAQEKKHSELYQSPTIWKRVLIPIFSELGIDLQAEAPATLQRIRWYLTGALAAIPIHAMIPPPSQKLAVDVHSLIISSYITTLNSHSKLKDLASDDVHNFLAVSMPHTPNMAPLPQTTLEVRNVTESLLSKGWPSEKIKWFDGQNASVQPTLEKLKDCTWLHLACHGVPDRSSTLDSSIVLSNGKLLLRTIADHQTRQGVQLAYLSACRAAEGAMGNLGEAMHLAAGFQFIGYRSIIATMWPIADDDAPIVAKHFYQYMMRNGMNRLLSSDAPEALHHAITQLRKDRSISPRYWAPFVCFCI